MKVFSVFISISLCSLNAFSMEHNLQETSSGWDEELKLPELINEALQKNSGLKSVKHLTNAKKAKIGPAGTYDDPKLGYNFSNYPVNSLASDKFNMTGREVSLQQKINFPGKLSKKENAAEFNYEAARHLYSEKEQELIFKVKKVYYELYFVHKEIDITRENINVLKQFSKLVKSRYRTGKGHQTDTIKVNLRLTDLKLKLMSLRKKLSIKEADLNVLLDRDAHTSLGKPVERLNIIPFKFKKHNMDHLYKLALKKNPEYSKYKSKIRSAEEEVTLASLNYLPDFTFGAKYRFRDVTRNDSTGEDFVSASVGITLPIFFWSKQSEQRKEAVQKKYAAVSKKISTERMLSHHIHHTYLSVKEMYDFLKIYRDEILPQTEQALKSSRAGYRVGSVDFLTSMDSEKQHFKSRTAYENTLSKYYQAISMLEKNVGASIKNW